MKQAEINFKSFKRIYYAFLIFFLITSIYLFPAFLGKIDTPIDIRDSRMYPWRYHMVDNKIGVVTLWEGRFNKNQLIKNKELNTNSYAWNTPPNSTNNILFKINLDEYKLKELGKLSNSNYYITFDFKPVYDKSVAFSFGLSLINRLTQTPFTPGVAIVPFSANSKGEGSNWYKAQFPLNNLLAKLSSVKDLNLFDVQITAKNKSTNGSALLYIENLKLVCEDFSHITKAHNHYNNDLIQMFAPFREYFSDSIKKWKLPFWNNYIFCGAEFLAEPQVGFFHPFYFLTYFIFDHFTAHLILTFICLFLCGGGAFLLASYWGLGFSASLLTGVVYMFQPFNATWMSYEHMLMNSATLPFLLLVYEKNIKEDKLLNKYLLASAFLFGLIFISGHLQYIYYSIIFFFLFVTFRFLANIFFYKKNYFKHIFSASFVFLIGLMIGAIVILPFLPMFINSHRPSIPVSLVRDTSVPLKALLGLFYPYYMGIPDWPLSGISNRTPEYESYKLGFMRNYVYFGLLPFLVSFFSLRKIIKDKLTIFFIGIIIISLLISTGTPLFFLIRNFLPGFKEMQHYRFLQLFSYSVPFLSGIGFQAFLDYMSSLTKKIKKYIVTAILVLTIADLMCFSSYFVTWSDRKDYKPQYKNGVLEFIQKELKKSKEPFRVLPFVSHKVEGTFLKPDIAEPNTLLPYKIEDVSGYSSFIPKDIYYLFVYIQTMDYNKLYSGQIFDLFSNINTPYPISNFHSKILDLLNVKYFIVPNFLTLESNKVKKVFTSDSTIYENKNYLPRAFIVKDFKVIESPKDTIVELDSERFDPKREVILMSVPHVILSASEESPDGVRSFVTNVPRDDTAALSLRGALATKQSPSVIPSDIKYKIDFLKYENNNITLKVKTNQAGFLILGHNLNNSWKVKINHKEGKHFQANLVQRAIYLPRAGEYLIEFYYFPKLFLIGLSISCLALLILISLLMLLYLQNKNLKTSIHNGFISSEKIKTTV